MEFFCGFVLSFAFLCRGIPPEKFTKWRLLCVRDYEEDDWLKNRQPIKFAVSRSVRNWGEYTLLILAAGSASRGQWDGNFAENMADIASMLVTTGIESPNKRAKIDSGLLATNFDESKFARYYRTDTVNPSSSPDSSAVVSNSSAYYSYPYTYASSISGFSLPYGPSTDTSTAYTYPASYGYNYTQLNGYSQDFSGVSFRLYGEISLIFQLARLVLSCIDNGGNFLFEAAILPMRRR